MTRKKQVPSAQAFTAAARRLVDGERRGRQVEISAQLGISRSFLNDLLNGRKQWSDKLRDGFAALYDTSVAELLLLGEQYLRTGHWFPHTSRLSGLTPRSIERADRIFRLAATDMKVNALDTFHSFESLMVKPATKAYLAGNLSDAEFYETWISAWKAALIHYLSADC